MRAFRSDWGVMMPQYLDGDTCIDVIGALVWRGGVTGTLYDHSAITLRCADMKPVPYIVVGWRRGAGGQWITAMRRAHGYAAR